MLGDSAVTMMRKRYPYSPVHDPQEKSWSVRPRKSREGRSSRNSREPGKKQRDKPREKACLPPLSAIAVFGFGTDAMRLEFYLTRKGQGGRQRKRQEGQETAATTTAVPAAVSADAAATAAAKQQERPTRRAVVWTSLGMRFSFCRVTGCSVARRSPSSILRLEQVVVANRMLQLPAAEMRKDCSRRIFTCNPELSGSDWC